MKKNRTKKIANKKFLEIGGGVGFGNGEGIK